MWYGHKDLIAIRTGLMITRAELVIWREHVGSSCDADKVLFLD
jgi:hypothetical protein